MEYSDEIHGNITIPAHIEQIIMTPVFQRLKNIQQLDIATIKDPEANHTRYEHCIGTYYLATKAMEGLEKNTKNLHIPDFYKKAVEIAALLHDVGHGPFSHMWEFVCDGTYHHEENSKACIDEIFNACHQPWMGDGRHYAIELIKSLILGKPDCLRDQEYRFLFDIVHNAKCGLDVDKWDYLKRDYQRIKHKIPEVDMSFDDIFMEARASEDRAHIEYRYCDFRKIYDLYHARAIFHIYYYKIPLNTCLEQICKYIIHTSRNTLERIDGIEVLNVRSKDVNAFLKLNEEEIWRILRSLDSPDEIVRLVNCFEKGNIIEIHPAKDEEKDVPEYLKVETKVKYAGEELREKEIHFYGDPSEKPSFEEQKGFHKSVSYFRVIP